MQASLRRFWGIFRGTFGLLEVKGGCLEVCKGSLTVKIKRKSNGSTLSCMYTEHPLAHHSCKTV